MRSGRINLKRVSIITLFFQPYIASPPFCLHKGDMQDTAHCVLLDERHVRLNLVHFKNSTELISRSLARCSTSLPGMQSSPEFVRRTKKSGQKVMIN